jgi:hypothetical protein
LDGLYLMVLVALRVIYGGDSSLPDVVATGIRGEQTLGLLDPHGVILDQHLNGLSRDKPGQERLCWLAHREQSIV